MPLEHLLDRVALVGTHALEQEITGSTVGAKQLPDYLVGAGEVERPHGAEVDHRDLLPFGL